MQEQSAQFQEPSAQQDMPEVLQGADFDAQSVATMGQAMDFVNGKAPYVFSAEEMEQMAGSNVFSLHDGHNLDLTTVLKGGAYEGIVSKMSDLDSGKDVHVVSLTLADVLSLPANNGLHQLALTGAANDQVLIDESEWVKTGDVIHEETGHSYAVYSGSTNASAQLLIDQQLVLNHQNT